MIADTVTPIMQRTIEPVNLSGIHKSLLQFQWKATYKLSAIMHFAPMLLYGSFSVPLIR